MKVVVNRDLRDKLSEKAILEVYKETLDSSWHTSICDIELSRVVRGERHLREVRSLSYIITFLNFSNRDRRQDYA